MNFDSKFDRREPLTVPTLIDLEAALAPFLQGRRLIHFEVLAGGFSNTNLKIKIENSNSPIVLRVSGKPRAEIEAELSVMDLLGSTIPVPAVLYSEMENPLLLKHLVVFEFLDGTPLDQVEDSWSESEASQFAESLGSVLAAVHHHKFLNSGLLGPNLSVRFPFTNFGAGIVDHMLECVESDRFKQRLPVHEVNRVRSFIRDMAGAIEPVENDSYLVHSDCNQKNILTAKRNGRWVVSGLLDWEYAFSGSPLMDFGNFFRFEEELPKGYSPALIDAYSASGGQLPSDWRRISKFLDLINMVQFLSDKNERPKTFAMARKVIDQTINSWN